MFIYIFWLWWNGFRNMEQAKNIAAIRWLPSASEALVFFKRDIPKERTKELYKKGLITKDEYNFNAIGRFFKVRFGN